MIIHKIYTQQASSVWTVRRISFDHNKNRALYFISMRYEGIFWGDTDGWVVSVDGVNPEGVFGCLCPLPVVRCESSLNVLMVDGCVSLAVKYRVHCLVGQLVSQIEGHKLNVGRTE